MSNVAAKTMPEKLVQKLEEDFDFNGRLHDARDAGMKKVERLADRVEDAMLQANRTARHMRFAAEDKLDQGRYQIKQNPIAAVMVAGAAGMFLGFIAGSYLKSKKCTE